MKLPPPSDFGVVVTGPESFERKKRLSTSAGYRLQKLNRERKAARHIRSYRRFEKAGSPIQFAEVGSMTSMHLRADGVLTMHNWSAGMFCKQQKKHCNPETADAIAAKYGFKPYDPDMCVSAEAEIRHAAGVPGYE